jgi:hypothetical protein
MVRAIRAYFASNFTFTGDQGMSTAYDVKYPKDMTQYGQSETIHWAESTIHSVVDSVEAFARAKPLEFALWSFGIGFALGWKLKPW